MESVLNFRRDAEDDYYSILGCSELSTAEQILCEFKVRSLDCHPDKNIGDPNAVKKFQQLLKAKEVLTDPETRTLYDKWRNSGICMPFYQFQNFSKIGHTSIHWACKKNKELMIEGQCVHKEECSVNKPEIPQLRRPVWEQDRGSALLQKFRNYEF